ncbi:MAG: radical SAM protein [Candidatus Edwardsbacteria bacterium]
MSKITSKLLGYKLFRQFGRPHLLPVNLTVSVTYHCNSRCKTCNIWRKKVYLAKIENPSPSQTLPAESSNEVREFTPEEFEKTFLSLGKTPHWITFSGGEPFLRHDFLEICKIAYRYCRPKVITIPTNGTLPKVISDTAAEICSLCPETKIILNCSIDEIGERHDEIRGIEGNYEQVLETYQRLRNLDCPNLTIGIGTVISTFNVDRFPVVYEEVMRLAPDSYVTEIAEEREELDTIGADIVPPLNKYVKAVDFLLMKLKTQKFVGLPKIIQSFRKEYYCLVKRVLREKRQAIPCYAGYASAHITPHGEIWACCVKAQVLGDLREADYNFRQLWVSEKAEEVRKDIKDKQCYCPLANVSYTNMLCHWQTLLRIGSNLFFRE